MKCRLCSSEIDQNESSIVMTPRGTQFFLKESEIAGDYPIPLHVTSCQYCGHMQSLGQSVIYDSHLSSASYVSGALSTHRLQQARQALHHLGRPVKSILEVGCGDGELLEKLSNIAPLAIGIEPSSKSVIRARERGIRVEEMLLFEKSTINGAPFDVFLSFHVLEHVPDVLPFLRGIRNNLAPDAVGCIEVPATEAAFDHRRYGDFMPDHLSYFFTDSLRHSLEMAGFEVIAIEREWGGEHLVAYVRVRRRAMHREIETWSLEVKEKLESFLDVALKKGKKVAFWGASHHLLPVLCNVSIQGILLVDAAATKQGHYTPGSHVLVHSPEKILEAHVDYVIVTAPRFIDEIEEELKTRFPAASISMETIDVGVARKIFSIKWGME